MDLVRYHKYCSLHILCAICMISENNPSPSSIVKLCLLFVIDACVLSSSTWTLLCAF